MAAEIRIGDKRATGIDPEGISGAPEQRVEAIRRLKGLIAIAHHYRFGLTKQ